MVCIGRDSRTDREKGKPWRKTEGKTEAGPDWRLLAWEAVGDNQEVGQSS